MFKRKYSLLLPLLALVTVGGCAESASFDDPGNLPGPSGAMGTMGVPGDRGPQGPVGKGAFLPPGTQCYELYDSQCTVRGSGVLLTTAFSGESYPPGQYDSMSGASDRDGNKVILSFGVQDGTPLDNISSVAVRANTTITTLGNFYLNMVVEDPESGKVGIIVVSAATVPGLNLGYQRAVVPIDFSQPIFTAVGGAFGLPPHTSSMGKPLPPGLVLRAVATHDRGMPKDVVTGPIMFVLGDSMNKRASRAEVSMVQIGLRNNSPLTYDFGAAN